MPGNDRTSYTPDDPQAGGAGGQEATNAYYAETASTSPGVETAPTSPGVDTAAGGLAAPDAASSPATPLGLASGGRGAPTTSDRVLATRTMIFEAADAIHVEHLQAQSVKIIRNSDATARAYFEFDNSERFELFEGQFFTPGGVFRSVRVTVDKATTLTVQFGARFSG